MVPSLLPKIEISQLLGLPDEEAAVNVSSPAVVVVVSAVAVVTVVPAVVVVTVPVVVVVTVVVDADIEETFSSSLETGVGKASEFMNEFPSR